MAKKEFTNPINNEKVDLDECKLSKSIDFLTLAISL